MAAGTGLFPAIILCTVLGLMSAQTFSMIGDASDLTNETDFKGLCSKTIGKHSAWMTDLSIFLNNFSGAVIYAGILGDVLTTLLQAAGLPPSLNRRGANVLALAAGALAPLSLLENLGGFMKYTSALGCLGVAYTVVFLAKRAGDGAYAPGGAFVEGLAQNLKPSFGNQSLWKCKLSSLVLVANLSLAYIAHFNAPRYYAELKDRSPARFSKAVYSAFLLLILIHAGAMVAGYATFGDNSQSNIINNYHPDDPWAILARVATFFSILFGYPLEFIGMRDGYLGTCRSFLELLPTDDKTTAGSGNGWQALARRALAGSSAPAQRRPLSLGLLALAAAVAAAVPDIGLTVGISGALIGAVIVYIIPVLVYYQSRVKFVPDKVDLKDKASLLYIRFGILVAVLGTGVTVWEYMQHPSVA